MVVQTKKNTRIFHTDLILRALTSDMSVYTCSMLDSHLLLLSLNLHKHNINKNPPISYSDSGPIK